MDKKTIKAYTDNIDGKMTVVASDESIDRSGDSLKIKDWDFKNFKANPVLQAGHDYRPQFTIGVAKNIRVEGSKVLFEPVFHTITTLAREIKEMYEQGVLKAWSVGFIPARKESGKNELLEVSAVAVPANANALVIAKGMNQEEEQVVKEQIDEFIIKEVDVKEEETKKEEVDEKIDEEIDEEEIDEKAEEVKEEVKEEIEDNEPDTETKDEETDEVEEEKKEEEIEEVEEEIKEEVVEEEKPETIDEEVDKKDVQEVVALTDIVGYLDFLVNMFTRNEVDEKSIKKMQKALALLMEVIKEQANVSKKEYELKEGKVISKKNRDKISSAVDITKQAIAELEKLLELTSDPEKSVDEVEVKDTLEKSEGTEAKGRDPKKVHKQLTSNELVVRTLKDIAKQTSFALNKVNK